MGHAKHWKTGVWVGMLLASTWAASCTPGELDEKQEKFLRNQIKKYYPVKTAQMDASAGEQQDSGVSPSVSPNTDQDASVSSTTSNPSTSVTSSGVSSEVTSAEVDAGQTPANEIPDCVMQMITTTCAGAACHSTGVIMPNLASPSLFELLTTTGSVCDTRNSDFYIDLENPQDSYLLQRIVGDGCGSVMPPPPNDPISDAELECLEGWLESL